MTFSRVSVCTPKVHHPCLFDGRYFRDAGAARCVMASFSISADGAVDTRADEG